jgi:hypothetical protein
MVTEETDKSRISRNSENALNALSQDEVKVIINDSTLKREDYPALVQARTMPISELAQYDVLNFSDHDKCHQLWRDYMKMHSHWVETQGYFLRERLRRDHRREPTQTEFNLALAEEVLNSPESERFRAFYAIGHPDQVIGHRHLEPAA